MRSKISRWILAGVLAIILTIGFFLDPWSTTGKEFVDLLPENTEDIQNITIVGDFDTLVLKLDQGQWKMGEEELNLKAVDNLLAAGAGISLKTIISGKDLPEIKSTAEFIFRSSAKKVGHFIFLSTENGSFILEPGAEKAFGVELTGYEKIPLDRFFSQNPDHYRQHLLIDLLPDEISLIRVNPLKGTAFIAIQDSLHNITMKSTGEPGDAILNAGEQNLRLLFSCFNALRYNKIITSEETETGILPAVPIASISLESFSGQHWELEIFSWIRKGETAPDIYQALVKFNRGAEYLSMNYFYLDLLIRGAEKY